jgi:polyferredoxin
MKTKEIKYRKSIQLLMIIFFPTVIVGGYFYPYLGFIVVTLICFFLALAPFKGRFFCGWFCPMGSFYERVLSLFSFKREIPSIFRKSWFRWLVFIAMMSILTLKLVSAGSNPENIADAFRSMWIISGSIAILIGIIFKPRLWCRICPMGSMQGVMSKNTYLLHISDDCAECKLCQRVCPISSTPFESKEKGFLNSEDCMRCFNCIENCPKKALKFAK